MTADYEPEPADLDAHVPCEARRENGQVCGICPACLAAMESDPRYRRRSDAP